MTDEPLQPDDPQSLPPHGDPLADVAVVPVTDAGSADGSEDGSTEDVTDAVAQAAAANLAELKQSLTQLQTELEGTAATGVPAVDEALAQLGQLDPEDLAGSAQILEGVLERLELALRESRQE